LPDLSATQQSWPAQGGELDMVTDSADMVHLFVYGHYLWNGREWQVEPLPALDPCATAVYKPKVALGQGNLVHLVTHEFMECQLGRVGFVGRGAVFYMRYQSAAPHILENPPATRQSVSPVLSAAAVHARPTTPTSTPTATPVPWRADGSPVGGESQSISHPEALGVGSALVIVVLTVLWQAGARRSGRFRR